MIVYKISPETASLIQGVEYADGIGFNAVEDAEGNYVLTAEQLEKWEKNTHFPKPRTTPPNSKKR